MADAAPAAPVAPVAPAKPNAPSQVANIAAKGAPAAAPAATAETPKAAEARVLKAIVDGEERTFTEAEASKLLSKAGYADKVIRQAKEVLKAAKEREAQLAEEDSLDDEEILKRRKRDPEAFARKVLERKLAESQLTPEQKELADYKAQLAERDAKLKAIEEEKFDPILSPLCDWCGYQKICPLWKHKFVENRQLETGEVKEAIAEYLDLKGKLSAEKLRLTMAPIKPCGYPEVLR